jgi:hypothetical protein
VVDLTELLRQSLGAKIAGKAATSASLPTLASTKTLTKRAAETLAKAKKMA